MEIDILVTELALTLIIVINAHWKRGLLMWCLSDKQLSQASRLDQPVGVAGSDHGWGCVVVRVWQVDTLSGIEF